MARGLYRAYLYVVTIALAVFLTVSVSSLLSVLLRLTALRGNYDSVPTGASVTQNVVLALVTLIIVAGLGGLHYWLIRRDMSSDPQPGESGVRAFTLNLALGVATLVAVSAGAAALSQFDLTFQNELAFSLATAISALGLALALAWERQRATPTRGAALVFQRLRIDGLGLILAFFTLTMLSSAVSRTENLIGNASGAIPCVAVQPQGPFTGPYLPTCVGSELIGIWAAAALVIVVWLIYLFRAGLQRTLIRPVFLLLGFAAGIVSLIYGLQRLAEYLLRLITATPGSAPDYFNNFNAAPTLVFAALALAVYGWRLTRSEAHQPLDALTTRLSIRAISAAIFAGPFWVGAWMLLNDALIKYFPGTQPSDTNWHLAFATAIAGVAYVPLALWLGAATRVEGVKGPRRGFVLALLAAGALATAGGAATLIYSVVTATLGVPLPNWQDVARQAGAALIVGLAVGGLYLWLAVREGQFTRAPRPEAEPATDIEGAATSAANGHVALDDVLAQFQQGGLSQAEAAERIRTLARAGALV